MEDKEYTEEEARKIAEEQFVRDLEESERTEEPPSCVDEELPIVQRILEDIGSDEE